MNISAIDLEFESLSKGGPAIVTGVQPAYEYDKETGAPNKNKVVGLKVTVVFPKNKFETQTVTVSDTVDKLSAMLENAEHSISVAFEDFRAKVYAMRGNDGKFRTGISAKASKVVVIDDAVDTDFDISIE